MCHLRCIGIATALAAWLGLFFAPRPAVAQADLQPIENRDYNIDLYRGPVLGSGRIVSMGGAQVAMAEGSVGLLSNPAAPAVRPATSNGRWDWDWHADWLNPGLGSDFDNNGIKVDEELQTLPVVTLGFVLRYRQWALGGTADFTQRAIPNPRAPGSLAPLFTVGRVALARHFRSLTIGAGVRVGQFSLSSVSVDGATTTPLFELSGDSLEAGLIWRPVDRNLRVGATLSLPSEPVEDENNQLCDPNDCQGLILPQKVLIPWTLSAGLSWRWAQTRWNRKVDARWRDERYVLLSADVVINGPVDNGHGIEAFYDKKLQPSGQSANISLRIGLEYEWKPSWIRLRAGSYWEPSRFRGVDGRLHGTAGLDVRFWSFCFWRKRYRARFSLTGDLANNYRNVGFSIGLWN